jgi:ribonucleoside-diphosphate reductase alpha chain
MSMSQAVASDVNLKPPLSIEAPMPITPLTPLPPLDWSDASLRVLRERYLEKDAAGTAERPEAMLWRVAAAVARAETAWNASPEFIQDAAQTFYDLMATRRFLPNSPTLMNAGKNNGLQYSGCFVLPIGDSMEEIFEAVKRAAIIHKSGGGTGFSFSRLRPKNARVCTTRGKASGPVSFLRVFNSATEAVKQGGTRRGANMAVLRVDHPDILEFVRCKLDGGITNFNISVGITEAFMAAYESDGTYPLTDPNTKKITGELRAREVFRQTVDCAWKSGDPGLVFIDRINQRRSNPVPALETIEATNPCGEQPLAPNDACNLGSLNLERFATPTGATEPVDWKALQEAVRSSVRFLDNVIQINPYPLTDIAAQVAKNRRIGLGVMGWADLLVRAQIPYDSAEALALAARVMECISTTAREASADLAIERGPFPHFKQSIYADGTPLRNAAITTIAPTGTISIIAGCSSGIEPLFAIAFRHDVEDRHLTFINPLFEEVAKRRGFYSEALMHQVVKQGTLHGIPGIPEEVRRIFVTAHEVAPEWHVRMQGAFQKHTDNGVSKTINLPRTATVGDVGAAYLLAYSLGCLGITVFRDGCKVGGQVLSVGTETAAKATAPVVTTAEPAQPKLPAYMAIQPRPRVLAGRSYETTTPLGTAYVHVNYTQTGDPFEVFLSLGKAGSDAHADAEALGRLMSVILRMPSSLTPVERVQNMVKQLRHIGGRQDTGFGAERVRSVPDAVGQVLEECLLAGPSLAAVQAAAQAATPVKNGTSNEPSTAQADLCPECHNFTLVFEESCLKCMSCGHSEC